MLKKLALSLLLFPFGLFAAIPVQGTFVASKFCPAYISKNKKNNPDNLSTQPATSYRLVSINRLSPNWVRIEFPSHTPAFRWVKSSCGSAQYEIKNRFSCDNQPGLADGNVLALHWLPAFCASYGLEQGLPECQDISGESYSANNFSLHGLWPQQKRCGEKFSYCNTVRQFNHCNYPEIELQSSVVKKLKKVMPGYSLGSCLERHEWSKHGTCQELSEDEYFAFASRLTEEMNRTALVKYVRAHIGEKINKEELRQKIRETFGYDAEKKIYLGCSNNMLIDVLLELPTFLPPEEDLQTLVSKAKGTMPTTECPEEIYISDFSYES